MSNLEISQIKSRQAELIAQRSKVCKLYNELAYTTSEYESALVSAGLSSTAAYSEIALLEKKITDEINRLPKVPMKDFMAWKKQQV